jgi:hypothetical protein
LPRLASHLIDLSLTWWTDRAAADRSAAAVVKALIASGHRLTRFAVFCLETEAEADRKQQPACELARAVRHLMRGNETIDELCFRCDETETADSPIAHLVDILCDNPRSALTALEVDDPRLAPATAMALTRLIVLPRLRLLCVPFDETAAIVRTTLSTAPVRRH